MKSEALLNEKVTTGLRAQFSPVRVDAVLAQAQSMFQEAQYRSVGTEPNKAEPYELFEGGWIDRALEVLGCGKWAIGRPKNGFAKQYQVGSIRHKLASIPKPKNHTGF